MASTYSTNLGLELIGTGDQAGAWGNTTNTNLGTLIEQAISGYVTQTITDGADTVITIPNGATGVARNMYIEMTGTLTAARNLIVPANKKLYFIYNNTTGGYAVTVKVSGQTGVSVANGNKVILVSNGTDVVAATNTIGGTLSVSSGGTGQSSYTNGQLLIGNTTGNTLTKATLTAGTGITITNGAGSITISTSGGAGTGDITFSSATISTANTNQNMVLSPNGTGEVVVNYTTSYWGAGDTPFEVVGDTSARVYPAIFVVRSQPRSVIVWNETTSGDAGLMAFYTDAPKTFRGNIGYNRASGVVAYNTTSDYRLKDVYGPVTDSGAKVDAIKIYRGKMHGATVERPMAIAHELAEQAPYAVMGTKDATDENGNPVYQQVDYTTLVPLLVAEIQSLRARVAALEAK